MNDNPTRGGLGPMIRFGRDPRVALLPDCRQYANLPALTAAVTGPAAQYLIDTDRSGARVFSLRSGATWARGFSGRWRRVPAGAATPPFRIALTMTLSDVTGEDVAGELRQVVAPWVSTLRAAERIAVSEFDAAPARVRELHDLVHAVMADTELRPHRIVQVVDDPDALAASLDADADLALSSCAALAFRHAAVLVRQHGTGVGQVGDVYPHRSVGLGVLVELLGNRRPGQTFRIEPAPTSTEATT